MAEHRARVARVRPAVPPPKPVLPPPRPLSLAHLCFCSCKMSTHLQLSRNCLQMCPLWEFVSVKKAPKVALWLGFLHLLCPLPTLHGAASSTRLPFTSPGAGTVPAAAGRAGMRTAMDLTRAPQVPASGSEKGCLPSLAHPPGWQEGGSPCSYPRL